MISTTYNHFFLSKFVYFSNQELVKYAKLIKLFFSAKTNEIPI